MVSSVSPGEGSVRCISRITADVTVSFVCEDSIRARRVWNRCVCVCGVDCGVSWIEGKGKGEREKEGKGKRTRGEAVGSARRSHPIVSTGAMILDRIAFMVLYVSSQSRGGRWLGWIVTSFWDLSSSSSRVRLVERAFLVEEGRARLGDGFSIAEEPSLTFLIGFPRGDRLGVLMSEIEF